MSNFHMMKDGIEPMWEDPQNEKGGKWVVCVPMKHRTSHLNQLWLWVVLACIGEAFDSDDVCGVVVSIRKNEDKICLWTRDAQNSSVVIGIGRKLKETVDLPPDKFIQYQAHSDSMRRNSSFNNKPRYEV